MDKLKIAIARGATCSGCEIEFVDINERLLDVLGIADIVYAPTLMDIKHKDVEAMPDKSIDICLYNGAVRLEESEYEAKLLAKKSKIMVAFGSCAYTGGIPGLANITNRQKIFETVYRDTASTENPDFVVPQTKCEVSGYELTLPELFDEGVKLLDDVVEVDYYLPGCPPLVGQINTLLDVVINWVGGKGELPPKGTVIASSKTLCEECNREKKENMRIQKIYRPHEIEIDPEKCLMEQGIICLGPATRGGCGAKCINDGNMPCRGCGGPTAAVLDQGGSILSAIASVLNITDSESTVTDEEIEKMVSQIVDPLGTFYRFGLPASLLKRKVTEKVV